MDAAIDGIITPESEPLAPVAKGEPESAVDGAAFVLDHPSDIPAVWGHGRQVLLAPGEALMIAGPQGVGKTTLAGLLVKGILGLVPSVLGLPVTDMQCKVLYLAMDRPRQIARSLARQFAESDRKTLGDQLVVWEGPPPRDLAANPALLAKMAVYYDAGMVFVDSLKDAAVGLSKDEVAAGYNRARQHLLAQGCQVVELHHTVKHGPQGAPIAGVNDVYGSTWLTSGVGSVVLLTGSPGDPIVGFRHIKQPQEEVGPYRLLHDQVAGTLTIDHVVDLIELVKASGAEGLTAKVAAVAINETSNPSRADVEKARRRLDQLASSGALVRVDGGRGGGGVRQTAAWFLSSPEQSRSITDRPKSAGQSNHAVSTPEGNHASITPITRKDKTAGQSNHASITPITRPAITTPPSSLEEGS